MNKGVNNPSATPPHAMVVRPFISANKKAIVALSAICAVVVLGLNVYWGAEPPLARLTRVADRCLSSVLSRGTLYYAIGVAIAMVIEACVLGYRDCSLRRLMRPSRSAVTDLFCILMMITGIGGMLSFIFSLGLGSIISDKLVALTPIGALASANPVVQTFWILVASDFIRYWQHYLQHKLSWFWELHKFHHSATEMTILTAGRFNPVGGAIDVVLLAIPTALLNGTAEEFVVLNILTTVWGGINHSMIPWRWGWLGRWIFNAPLNHRIHHSALPEHADKNLAAMFVLWDRLFGTFYTGASVNETVSVTDNIYNRNGLVYDILVNLWCMVAKLPLIGRFVPPAPTLMDEASMATASIRQHL